MEENWADWQRRDREARAVTASLKGPEPKHNTILAIIITAVVVFSISLAALTFAGVPHKKSDVIVLLMTAICAGATFLYKYLAHEFWYREYRAQMDMRAPKPQPQEPPALHFKDAKSALEYSCEYLDTTFKDGEYTPCIVVVTSSSKESGTFAVIDIPTDAGIKRSIAAFSTSDAPPAVAGKLCAAMIGPVLEETGAPTFLIFAELEPTWSDGAWMIKRRF